MKPCIVKTVNRFTVAGTVYEFHVLPYSPAFKPAPVTIRKNNMVCSYEKKHILQTPDFQRFSCKRPN